MRDTDYHIKLSDEQFRLGFHRIAGSSNPTILPDWSGEDGTFAQFQSDEGDADIDLEITFKFLFNAPKVFFMTSISGVYGICPPGTKVGDEIAFLFPPLFMAFVLRPCGDKYQMVGPCFVPPRARDMFMDRMVVCGRELDEFVIV